MPKIKTLKLVSKRIKKTATGKIMKKSVGQSHYNARENGKHKRNKRREKAFSKVETKIINTVTPYTK